jgi:hypothetical protein
MGIITICFILGNLPFFATSVINVFVEGSNFDRAVNLIVCIYFFTSLFLAAKACREVSAGVVCICYGLLVYAHAQLAYLYACRRNFMQIRNKGKMSILFLEQNFMLFPMVHLLLL